MRVWVSVGALQNERGKLFFAPFARSSATPCRLFRVHRDRATRIFGSRPSEPAAASAAPSRSSAGAHPYPPCAARRSRARSRTCALRARVRHFSFFAFTASPLCRKPLSDSRFGVKAFPKMLHRGEASIPPPSFGLQSAAQSPTHPLRVGDENHEKPPAKFRKTGDSAPKLPSGAVKAWVKGFSAKPSPLTA